MAYGTAEEYLFKGQQEFHMECVIYFLPLTNTGAWVQACKLQSTTWICLPDLVFCYQHLLRLLCPPYLTAYPSNQLVRTSHHVGIDQTSHLLAYPSN